MKLKTEIISLILLILITNPLFSEEILTRKDDSKIVIYEDYTWSEYNPDSSSIEEIINKYSSFLRAGIEATNEEIAIACTMLDQGWIYTMPRPKSSKAAWGVSDGRTTWYNGWWYNSKSNLYSRTTPRKSTSGLYLGDNQNNAHTWRNGGAPGRPDIFMFLLSKSGGPRY